MIAVKYGITRELCPQDTECVCESWSLEKSIDNMQSIPEIQLVVNRVCIF